VIHFIDEAIETLLRREVPLPEATVDISFAAPDRAWGAGVTRPTVNVFLWDIRRNNLRTTGGLAQQAANGQVARRPSSPVVDLRYLVTAWAAEHRDEHQLLGSVLVCVLANSSVPPEDLPSQLATTSSLSLSLASEDARVPGEFWSSLDGRLKPGLQIVVSVPLEIFSWVPAGPPVASVSVASQRLPQAPSPSVGGWPGRRAAYTAVAGAGAGEAGAGEEPPDGGASGAAGPSASQDEESQRTTGPVDETEPVFRRRRSSGMLTMEGRPVSSPSTSADDGGTPAENEGP
jgi:hypothetical protein